MNGEVQGTEMKTELKTAVEFVTLAVTVEGEAPAVLAAGLRADWQRQEVDWRRSHRLTLLPLNNEESIKPERDEAGEGTRSPAQVQAQTQKARTQNGPLAFHVQDEVYRLAEGGLSVQTGPEHSRIELGSGALAAALTLAFTEVQRAAGLLPLHASVLGRDGQTVAISGPSGAGKSTAALRLLGRGWHLVAEDWAWLDPANMQLVGWDSGLRLRPESLERFAPELMRDAPTDVHGKKVLSPPRLSGVQTLNAVHFLSAVSSASRLELVRGVWGMVGAPLTPAARRATQAGVNTLMSGMQMELADRNELVARLGV